MIGTRAGRILGTALFVTLLGSGWGGLRAETLEGDCSPPPLLAAALPLQAVSQAAAASGIGVKRATFQGTEGWLTVEVLADEVVHFESGAGRAPADAPLATSPIATSPMVAKKDYLGPSRYQQAGTKLDTAALVVTVDPATLCVSTFDKRRGYSLGTVCPRKAGLTIDPQGAKNAYGLGEELVEPDKLPDDWNGKVRGSHDPFGNQMEPFGGGAGGQAGNVQIPVLFALGEGTKGFGLFLDSVYKQTWDFTGPEWKVEVTGGDSQ